MISENRTYVSSIKYNGEVDSSYANSEKGVRSCITLNYNFNN